MLATVELGDTVLYLLAIFCPPLAVLLCGKPGQAAINFVLWLLLWVPGTIHAWAIVSEHKANERTATLVRAMTAGKADGAEG
jgi:uncharacterized membrane protein YqaE (UPF0057 family)